jgi:peroxiredoxin
VKTGDIVATLLALGVGVPLAFLFASAMADGAERHREGPLRALLGNDAYEAIARGDQPPLGYFGNDRLAPDFTLRDAHGRAFRLRDHRGHVVVMNFWTVTCGPCVEELPTLDGLAQILARTRPDVDVVLVSTDRDLATDAAVLPEGFRFALLFDPDRHVVRGRYGTRLYPETWIVDKAGIIRARVDGGRDWTSPAVTELIDSLR